MILNLIKSLQTPQIGLIQNEVSSPHGIQSHYLLYILFTRSSLQSATAFWNNWSQILPNVGGKKHIVKWILTLDNKSQDTFSPTLGRQRQVWVDNVASRRHGLWNTSLSVMHGYCHGDHRTTQTTITIALCLPKLPGKTVLRKILYSTWDRLERSHCCLQCCRHYAGHRRGQVSVVSSTGSRMPNTHLPGESLPLAQW